MFSAVFLDSQHRVISFEELFHGTIDSASVYPHEVVKQALANNAAAVVLVHNHPSGGPEPSDADRRIIPRLKDALTLIEVRVIDHIVVGIDSCVIAGRSGRPIVASAW
ncbi:JAB domain-containing protein [Halomonas caseinilytica]|uniref:DNA repair protein RadC n=1 Tax=Halomonas caseinilytica TaxID=438744 RepID=A0A1M6VGL6_9GAMM|nr:DNA repair protein RadC [Halomonas caseinilytica]